MNINLLGIQTSPAAWGIAGKGMSMPSRNDEDNRHE